MRCEGAVARAGQRKCDHHLIGRKLRLPQPAAPRSFADRLRRPRGKVFVAAAAASAAAALAAAAASSSSVVTLRGREAAMAAVGDAGAQAFYDTLRQGSPPMLRRPPGPIPLKGHFSTVLQYAVKQIVDHGVSSMSDYVHHDGGEFVTLFDGYPKAEVHLLALPKDQNISGPQLLAGDPSRHLPMLKRLSAYVAWLLENLATSRPDLTWRHGVHAHPSLLQLHVHVISQDFQSPCMKNKKHWNSFQPPFLVPLDDIIDALEDGSISPGSRVALALDGKGAAGKQGEAWLRGDMVCRGVNFGNKFADLKRHLVSCKPPPSASPPRRWSGSSATGEHEEEPVASESSAAGSAIGTGTAFTVAMSGPLAATSIEAAARAAAGPHFKRPRVEVIELPDSD